MRSFLDRVRTGKNEPELERRVLELQTENATLRRRVRHLRAALYAHANKMTHTVALDGDDPPGDST